MIIKNRITGLVLLLIIFLYTAIGLLSCNFFTEPEPYVNTNAKPTEKKSYILSNYKENQVMAGTIVLPFKPDVDTTEISYVSLYVDSQKVAVVENPPYTFSLETEKWPDGIHELKFFVFKKVNDLGLLELRNSPSQIYGISLTFNNTPLTTVSNISVQNINNHSQISWSPTNLPNFYDYVIKRNGEIIANIYNQNDSVFVDSIYTLADFYRINYEVGVANTGSIKYSQPYTLSKGQSLMLNSVIDAVDGLNDLVIFRANTLVAISCNTLQELGHYNNINNPGWFAPSFDQKYLFQFQYDELRTLDINTLQFLGRQSIFAQTNPNYAVCGKNNSIFMTNNTTRDLEIYQKDWYTTVLRNKFDRPISFMSISPDGKQLLTGDKVEITKYSIDSVDQSLISVIMISGNADSVSLLKVDWNNTMMFVKKQSSIIEIWNPEDFNFKSSFSLNVPANTGEIYAISANSTNLFIAYSTTLNNNEATLLAKFDIQSKMLLQTWILPSKITSLYGSENGRYIFACDNMDQWAVDIGGTK